MADPVAHGIDMLNIDLLLLVPFAMMSKRIPEHAQPIQISKQFRRPRDSVSNQPCMRLPARIIAQDQWQEPQCYAFAEAAGVAHYLLYRVPHAARIACTSGNMRQ